MIKYIYKKLFDLLQLFRLRSKCVRKHKISILKKKNKYEQKRLARNIFFDKEYYAFFLIIILSLIQFINLLRNYSSKSFNIMMNLFSLAVIYNKVLIVHELNELIKRIGNE
ncbi:hypothetical protein BNATCHR368 (nucleomorph) [Bigelowiella natans]|uniref:Uncharacterized protein n=1 Tax=Bigelowiella natans TaxID=227086 RepID=Q3LVY4_BIGNA|nr:hypothetical protein BNATCHR368 [Bigelowiella natans]ABA27382.1 hypothetical protein [Bigelowiella natans]|mmetsp:Transcript_13518/g.16143  ORF Transcript_13518/g.16143 Transcript_13518/m.16143 type:complete len:111 (-) Transcript_13518:1362-1694(-)